MFELQNARATVRSVNLREIPGFEGDYAASDDGRVWSHAKKTGRAHSGRFLSPWIAANGYPCVALKRGGERHKWYVHRLVALTWIDNDQPAVRTHINHRNGIKHDNRVENLEWVSQGENNVHAIEAGLRRYRTALPIEALPEIRSRISRGDLLREIAADYGVSRTIISYVKSDRYAPSTLRQAV